jgi:hypothetical protein
MRWWKGCQHRTIAVQSHPRQKPLQERWCKYFVCCANVMRRGAANNTCYWRLRTQRACAWVDWASCGMSARFGPARGVGHASVLLERTPSAHVMRNAFIAAVIGSEKNTGSTRSTMSPETSRKFRLFSSGISALHAPLSIATCKGSAKDRIGLMFP